MKLSQILNINKDDVSEGIINGNFKIPSGAIA